MKRQSANRRGRRGKENVGGSTSIAGHKRKAERPPRRTVSSHQTDGYVVTVCDPTKRVKLPLTDCGNVREAEAASQPRLGQ